jgi:hypothetical protein
MANGDERVRRAEVDPDVVREEPEQAVEDAQGASSWDGEMTCRGTPAGRLGMVASVTDRPAAGNAKPPLTIVR